MVSIAHNFVGAEASLTAYFPYDYLYRYRDSAVCAVGDGQVATGGLITALRDMSKKNVFFPSVNPDHHSMMPGTLNGVPIMAYSGNTASEGYDLDLSVFDGMSGFTLAFVGQTLATGTIFAISHPVSTAGMIELHQSTTTAIEFRARRTSETETAASQSVSASFTAIQGIIATLDFTGSGALHIEKTDGQSFDVSGLPGTADVLPVYDPSKFAATAFGRRRQGSPAANRYKGNASLLLAIPSLLTGQAMTDLRALVAAMQADLAA